MTQGTHLSGQGIQCQDTTERNTRGASGQHITKGKHGSLYGGGLYTKLTTLCTMTPRSRSVKVDLGDPTTTEPTTFMEIWKAHVEERKKSGGHVSCTRRMFRGLVVFMAPSQIYVTLVYLIPNLFSDYDDWMQYYLKVLICFIWVELLANYMSVILYDTSFKKTRDNPNVSGLNDRWSNPPDQFVPLELHSNGYANGHVTDSGELPWQHCDVCDIDIPPRTKHCKFCKMCILKRDHHCFVVGSCIGHKNQRYFVVLNFYTMWAGTWGAYMTFQYLKLFYWSDSSTLDFLLPVTVYRTFLGHLPLHIGILIFHLYVEVLFGFVGFVYSTMQMVMIVQGKTLYELSKKLPVRNTNTINANFVSVFGNFWALNFIFPMQIIFRQHDDGIKWNGVKMDRFKNYIKECQ